MRYKKLNIFFTICFIVMFVISVVSTQANKISLYLIIPLLFIYSFTKNPRLILKFKPLFIFLLLIIWSGITTLKSINLNASLNELWLLTSVFVLSYIIVSFSSQNVKYLHLFYLLFIIRYFALLYKGYMIGITSVNVDSERFSDIELNANMFGYFGYFAIWSSFFIWRFSFKNFQFTSKNRLLFLLIIMTSIAALAGSFYAASRGGIIMALITLGLCFSFTYLFPFSKNTIVGLIILAAVFFIFVPIGMQYYKGSFLEYRFNALDIQEQSRFKLLQMAFQVGSNNPVFGVGPGNFLFYTPTKHYSHSTYFEVFANNGIIGLLIFLYLFVSYFKMNKKLFQTDDKNEKRAAWYFIVFLITFGAYNIFYVFHTSLFLMAFFFLINIHLKLYLESKTIKSNE